MSLFSAAVRYIESPREVTSNTFPQVSSRATIGVDRPRRSAVADPYERFFQ